MSENKQPRKSGYMVLYIIGSLALISGIYLMFSKGLEDVSSWSGMLSGVTLLFVAYQNQKNPISAQKENLDAKATVED